jgi:hypothetical protein
MTSGANPPIGTLLCVKALGGLLQNRNTTECKQHNVYKFLQDILVTQPVLLSLIGIVIGELQDCSTDRIIGNSQLIHKKTVSANAATWYVRP